MTGERTATEEEIICEYCGLDHDLYTECPPCLDDSDALVRYGATS